MQTFKYLKSCEKTKTTIARKFLIMVSITVPDGNVSHGKFLTIICSKWKTNRNLSQPGRKEPSQPWQ